MQQAARPLNDFGVAYDARVISAHRSPELLSTYVQEMIDQGVQCFIAGAGGAAHLAGANAGLFAIAMLALNDPQLAKRLVEFRKQQA